MALGDGWLGRMAGNSHATIVVAVLSWKPCKGEGSSQFHPPPLSQQVLSALGGEEEEGDQVPAQDPAAASGEPVTPLLQPDASDAAGGPAG